MREMNEKAKILVVDDEEVFRKSLNRILSKEGYSIVEAQDAEKAVEKMETEAFDIALIDMVMPKVTGLEFMGTLKKKWPDTIAIVITGYATVESAVEAMRLGAFDFISKPFEPSKIILTVEKALKAKKGIEVPERMEAVSKPEKDKQGVVVIGGSAAGLTAAITARRHYPGKKITIVRKEEKVLIPCGIPYIFGTVGSPDKNLVPDAALDKNNIDLTVGEVTKIDRKNKIVSTKDGKEVPYEKLIIATGSLPIAPPIPGADKENVFTILKDIPLLEKIQGKLKDVKDLVVIGGGFIGVEFADELHKSGIPNVTIVEMLPHCLMLAYDEEFCLEAEKVLKERGINLATGSRIEEIIGDKKVSGVRLANGTELKADAIIIGIGARADVKLAEESGLELGPTGSIMVDRTMRTTDEDIFACGDCSEKVSFFGGKPSPLKLASIAAAEARIAGANLFGIRRENIGTVGVWSTAIGNNAFAGAGLTESLARRQGYNIVAGTAEAPNRHPGGMPGMAKLTVKLIFERRTGVLLGTQIMGDTSAGDLINIASACIQKRMTADEIASFQMGTHPALTASPIAYQFVNAAEIAMVAMRKHPVST
jgi:NADPH-dependent 2,4-dienoyl-CoA reductase/sulfur reductase-like enzyme/CheY-like chemotaxis protein